MAFSAGEARAAYLQGACGGDAELRARVELLIQAHEAAGGFLPDRAVANGPTVQVDPPGEERTGDRIGRYKLLQPIGEGGCGVVYVRCRFAWGRL